MATDQSTPEESALLRRQLERERRARRAAEQIGEAATAELWETVQRLEQAEAELRERADLSDLTYALSRSLRADLDPGLMLERAVRALGEALGVDRVVVRLAEEGHIGGVVTQWVRPGATGLPTDSQLHPSFRRLVVDHADREEALWIDDLADDARVPEPRQAWSRLRSAGRTPAYPCSPAQRLVGWLALHTQSDPRAWSAARPDRGAGAGPRPERRPAPGAGPPAPGRHGPRAPADRRGQERLRVARLPRAAHAARRASAATPSCWPTVRWASPRRRSSAPSTSSCATASGCCPSRRTCSASRGSTLTSSRPSATRSTCWGCWVAWVIARCRLLVGRHVDLLLPDAGTRRRRAVGRRGRARAGAGQPARATP